MRRSAVLAVALLLVMAAILGGQVVLKTVGSGGLTDLFFSLSVATFTVVGALIVWRRPGNPVGWVFAAVGLLWGTGDLASGYATYGAENGSDVPFLTLAAWYGEWFWLAWLNMMFFVVPMLFPTGRPMSPRWRRWFVFVLAYAALLIGAAMLEEELAIVGTDLALINPVGIDGLRDIEHGAFAILVFPFILVTLVSGLFSIVLRYRRSQGDERQQLKWFALAVSAFVIEFLAQIIADSVFGTRSEYLDSIFLTLVPGAAAIAILRYRLYDVDVVINRTLVYGLLTAVLAAIYVGFVFAFQALLQPFTAESDLAIAGSTLAVAGLFRPARSRVQSFIDRRFYRRKVDAQRTLDEFTGELRDEVDLASLSSRLTAVVTETMQPAHVSLWLRAKESS